MVIDYGSATVNLSSDLVARLFFRLSHLFIGCYTIIMTATDLQLPMSIDELRQVLKAHGVVGASIFGSYARGEAREDSDLDILVDYADGVSLFDHFDLRDELVKHSGKRVDLVSSRALSRHFRPYIEKDKVKIL